jgi:predicted enzyme related to lactoylglutathione lyase
MCVKIASQKVKYLHTNIIAEDWRKLSAFYQKIFNCVPIPPMRNLSGQWLENATGIPEAEIQGIHLLLPGYSAKGPTLEIFQYSTMPKHIKTIPNTPGIVHLAFSVEDLEEVTEAVLRAGGGKVGEVTTVEITGVGKIKFVYITDPEGNIIELQQARELNNG